MTWTMQNWRSKMTGLAAVILVAAYVLGFSGSYLFYVISSISSFLTTDAVALKSLLGWLTVGISVSLLATLCAWPFALSVATLMEHNKARPTANYLLKLISYVASIPLLLFVYVYIEVIGVSGFSAVKSFWVTLFASPNFFTKGVAFSLTLLLYPLTAIPGLGESLTIDLFYREMLGAVIEFAEVGLVSSIIVIGLFLYVFPKMVLYMRRQLHDDENLRSFEIIKSIGGTPWESIHLTVMQSMKDRFNQIVVYFTRKCFFEALITFTLLNVFFLQDAGQQFHWSSSLSTVFLSSSLKGGNLDSLLVVTAGLLTFSYLVFVYLERYFRKQRELING